MVWQSQMWSFSKQEYYLLSNDTLSDEEDASESSLTLAFVWAILALYDCVIFQESRFQGKTYDQK